MSAICARLSKGKIGVQRGRETAGVPSFLPPPRARRIPALRRAQLPAEVQRKTPRPSGSNPPAAVRVPRSASAEKEPPGEGEPACGSSCAPVSRCSQRSRPSGANPPAAVRVPRSAGAEKEPPRRGEHADAVRVPRSADAEKEPPVRGEPAHAGRVPRLSGAEKGAARKGRTR